MDDLTPDLDRSRPTRRPVRFVLFLLLLVGIFAGGIVFERLVLDGRSVDAAAGGLNYDLLEEERAIIQDRYVVRDSAADQQLQYGAMAGMVDVLGDFGHSRFMTPDMVEAQRNYTAGEFEGIGAYIEMRDGYVTVVAPIDNSPAQAAGVAPGDVVIGVDGQDVTGMSLQEVRALIVGPAGTTVTITFLNPETGEERTLTIARARIELENVTWIILPGTTVAHIRIAGFSANVGDDLAAAIAEAGAQGATGIILDLRSNPGGLLNEAVAVASQFLPAESVVVLRQDADDHVEREPVDSDATPTDLPVVVLINQGSASASEIVAGALQDYKRATLVGETTFGTGTVLKEFPLSDGSALLLATEQWLTPNGRVIWREGIVPDEVVDLNGQVQLVTPVGAREMTAEQLATSEDAQVLRALELLGGR